MYENTAPAHCLGLSGEEPVYVALRTVPMGWISAVGVVQAAIRHLAFKIAKLPAEAEIQKWKEIPEADKLLLYLDSVDQLRLVSKTMVAVHENEASEEHKKFKRHVRTGDSQPMPLRHWLGHWSALYRAVSCAHELGCSCCS